MREILFKAKRTEDGEWVEGSYVKMNGCAYIVPWYASAWYGFEVDPETVGQYTKIDTIHEVGWIFRVNKIFTGDMLGEWGEDEDGNECFCILGVVTYWESEGRYVLADEDGLCNDWTLEDCAQPENWPNLIYLGNIHDKEGSHA